MNPNVFKFFDALTTCSPILLLCGILLGMVYFEKLDRLHKLLYLFLIMALAIDLLGRLMGRFYGNNLILIPIYGFLEFLLLAHIYFRYFILVKNKLWLIAIGIIACYNLYEIITLFNVDPSNFNSHARVIDSGAIVVLSIIFYIKQIADEVPIKSSFLFLNTIIFAFHSLNLILYLPINFLINEGSDIKFHFWTASLILTLVFYTSIIRMIWIHGKNHKP